jgi:hydrogenase maturation protein HypF
MTLEALAQKAPPEEMAFYYDINASDLTIDTAGMWASIRYDLENGVAAEIIALRFHSAIARAFASAAVGLVQQGQAQAIALSGGCFQSALLLDLTCHWIMAEARTLGVSAPVLIHTKTPANDGGLALGQALIAAARHLG